jgi:hypothetical protein
MRDDGLLLPAYLGGGEANAGSKPKPDPSAKPSGKPGPDGDDEPDPDPEDAFGLSSDDWISLTGGSPEFYSRTAMLWWALAGVEDDGSPVSKTEAALRNFILAVRADVQALMATTRCSSEDNVRALAGSLENVCRRLALAAEIAETLIEAEFDRPVHRQKRPKVSPMPKKRKKAI